MLAWTERTERVAVAPSRSNDHRAGVARAETSLHDNPPVPMTTMEPVRSLPAAREEARADEAEVRAPITRAASSTATVAAASSRRRVTSNRLLGGSEQEGDVGDPLLGPQRAHRQGLRHRRDVGLAETGLARPGIDRVEIHHDVDNPVSGRVAVKAGFHGLGPIEAEKKAPGDSGTHLVWACRRPHPT